MVAKTDPQAFLKRARVNNPNIKFLTTYVGLDHPIKVVCPRCTKPFTLNAARRLDNPVTCDKCKVAHNRLTHEEFVKRIKARHGTRLTVLSRYENVQTRIKMKCSAGHLLDGLAGSYLTGEGGCRQCANTERAWTDRSLRAEIKRLQPKLKLTEPYKGNCTLLHGFKCLKCKQEWQTRPSSIIHKKSGCPVCAINSKFSNIAIAWLEVEARKRRIVIEHGRNVGEYRIPGTRLSVDGYNRRSNTVFEFYGDAWHGNPKVYKPNERPLSHIHATAGELHAKTKAREKKLRALGYTVVVMWERDFKRSLLNLSEQVRLK